MNPFDWDGWASAALSFIAIVIGILLAGWAVRIAKQIADQQAAQEREIAGRQHAQERESYLQSRMQGLVDHARGTVIESRTIWNLTSERFRGLLSLADADSSERRERQQAVVEALTRLEVQVALLRVYAITMPSTSSKPSAEAVTSLHALMDEGAWLYSEAFHVATLAFEEVNENEDLSNKESVVDAVLNGSFVNLNVRLLSDCIGLDPENIPTYGEEGSPWPAVYKRRERLLLDAELYSDSSAPTSLAEAAAWSFDYTMNRYEDALIDVLSVWNSLTESSR